MSLDFGLGMLYNLMLWSIRNNLYKKHHLRTMKNELFNEITIQQQNTKCEKIVNPDANTEGLRYCFIK